MIGPYEFHRNDCEKDRSNRDHSDQPEGGRFVWRAGYYDIVLAVVQIEHGVQAAMDIGPVVLNLYGESLEEYMKEMSDA